MEIDDLKQKLLILTTRAWDSRIDWQAVERWLTNFTGVHGDVEKERRHALFLLTHVSFFSLTLIRELLRALYAQLYRYPLVSAIRRRNADTRDSIFINQLFAEELAATRFLGIGNPSESGPHLLYFFRQVNALSKSLFIDSAQILTITRDSGENASVTIRDPTIRRYVYIDDLLASATQISTYMPSLFSEIRRAAPHAELCYYSLFATSAGLKAAREPGLFGNNVDCVFELDDSFKCFSPDSRYFASVDSGIDRAFAEAMTLAYGQAIFPTYPLGYKDGQLLLAFDHNTPDNTLPIIWSDILKPTVWVPIFKRFEKVY